jgi:hypothetical protein
MDTPSSDLTLLVEKSVIVCLDSRLERTGGFLQPPVFATFHRQGGRAVLSLSNGILNSFFTAAASRDAGEAIRALTSRNPTFQKDGNALSLCRLYVAPAAARVRPNYEWQDASHHGKVLCNHPSLRNPPVCSVY